MPGQDTKPSRLDNLPEWMQFVWRARRRYTHRNGPLNAAGLAYVAFLSFPPMALFLMGLGAIFLGSPESARTYLTDVAGRVLPSVAKLLTHDIREIVARRQLAGVIGLVGLGISGTAFFRSAEEALIALWDRKSTRGFVTSILLDLAVTGIAVLLAGGSVAATVLANWASEWTTLPLLAACAGWTVSILCKALAIYCVFGWLPPTAPRARSNVIVSLVAAAAMELTKPLFTVYVSHFGRYGAIYGPISAVAVSLVYLYILLVIFLMAASVLAELDAGPSTKQPEPSQESR